MHKSIIILAVAALAVLPGCMTPTQSVIQEYDVTTGKLSKQTTTTESVVKTLVESTKSKTVIAWESGWVGYISVALMTTDDPTPHIKMFAGKADKGMISAQPGQSNWDGIAQAILATKQDINLSLTGISGTSSTSKASETAAINPATAPNVVNVLQTTVPATSAAATTQ